MKKSRYIMGSICGAALLLAGGMAQADQVLSQNVVGYYNITIDQGLNLIAFPFQKIPAARGVVTANDGGTITVEGAGWAADFNYDEPGQSTFYVEITTGVFEGRHMYIDSHTADTLTIAGGLPADMAAGELVGEGIKIVAANRVRDLFGEPGSPALAGGGSAAAADAVLRFDSGWMGAVYYRTIAPNAGNWVRGITPVNDEVIDRDEGIFVRRHSDESAILTIVGEVSPNAQQIVLQQGLNLVGGLSVVEEPIADSDMVPNTLTGGGSAAAADTIIEWGPNGWLSALYYRTLAPNANNWVRGISPVDFSFMPTKGYFLRLNNPPVGTWRRESALAAQ